MLGFVLLSRRHWTNKQAERKQVEEDRREEERESGAFILKNKKKPEIKTSPSKLLIPPNKANSVNSTVVTQSTAPASTEMKEEEPEASINQLIDGETVENKGDESLAPQGLLPHYDPKYRY
jgi:hypothetical protein